MGVGFDGELPPPAPANILVFGQLEVASPPLSFGEAHWSNEQAAQLVMLGPLPASEHTTLGEEPEHRMHWSIWVQVASSGASRPTHSATVAG
jgi:hypothetical protein